MTRLLAFLRSLTSPQWQARFASEDTGEWVRTSRITGRQITKPMEPGELEAAVVEGRIR